jgi:hypothetical protein
VPKCHWPTYPSAHFKLVELDCSCGVTLGQLADKSW